MRVWAIETKAELLERSLQVGVQPFVGGESSNEEDGLTFHRFNT